LLKFAAFLRDEKEQALRSVYNKFENVMTFLNGTEVSSAIRSMNIKAVRTAIGCPWQNGVAERWVGSCRRELLDHVIAISESHLKRLLSSYVAYYHQDRTPCGLEKQTPEKRTCCSRRGNVVAWPRVGGLHHRYERAA
jgi:transposase InsO family protein